MKPRLDTQGEPYDRSEAARHRTHEEDGVIEPNVEFESDGNILKAWLRKPDKGKGPFAALIWNHGDGDLENEVSLPTTLVKAFNDRGFVVLAPIRRSRLESLTAIEDSVERHEVDNRDVFNAMVWLSKKAFVDPRRIIVSGFSGGGIQTMLSVEKGEGFRAGVAFGGGAKSWKDGTGAEPMRLKQAVLNRKRPLFILQAKNDYSLGPVKELGPLLKKSELLYNEKEYPEYGKYPGPRSKELTKEEEKEWHNKAHVDFPKFGVHVWGHDVFGFIKEALGPAGADWRGWQDLGGPIASAPAVASWGEDRLDVFAAGADGKLNRKWWDGSKWHDWQNLGGTFKGAPAAVSWGKNRIDVFVRGMDDHLRHFWWNGSEWKGWEDLGGPIASAPAVASWGEDRLDVFAAGADGKLNRKWWDGSKWHDWHSLEGTFKGGPAAVSWGKNRIDVFVCTRDDHLGHLRWNGSDWGWEDLGWRITSAPAVASWGEDRLDVFAAGLDGNLEHKSYDGSKWSDWDWIGGTFHGDPVAVSWGKNRIDVFVRGMDDHLGHLWRE